jgi:hypothetical protein
MAPTEATPHEQQAAGIFRLQAGSPLVGVPSHATLQPPAPRESRRNINRKSVLRWNQGRIAGFHSGGKSFMTAAAQDAL